MDGAGALAQPSYALRLRATPALSPPTLSRRAKQHFEARDSRVTGKRKVSFRKAISACDRQVKGSLYPYAIRLVVQGESVGTLRQASERLTISRLSLLVTGIVKGNLALACLAPVTTAEMLFCPSCLCLVVNRPSPSRASKTQRRARTPSTHGDAVRRGKNDQDDPRLPCATGNTA